MSAGYSVVGAVDAMRRFPQSCEKVGIAEELLRRGGQHFTCRHVMAGAAPILCTDHPNLGLQCEPCMRRRHVPRHSDEEEHRCDECGKVARALHALASTIVLTGIRIREPRGRSGRYTGPVSFIAVGVCPSCWRPA
jgi:hypothetical protein